MFFCQEVEALSLIKHKGDAVEASPLWSWPPDYIIRRSKRAKRIGLQLDRDRGLVLVLPERTSKAKGQAFLESNRAWVEKNKAFLLRLKQPPLWPKSLGLPALAATKTVHYHEAEAYGVILRDEVDGLHFYGSREVPGAQDAFKRCLRRWMLRQAKPFFLARVQLWSKKQAQAVRDVRVGWQRARWGSCASDGVINLNAKLLFHEPEQVDYVVWHELCHLTEMNHSRAFWQQLAEGMPDYKARRTRLQSDALPWYGR
jgi:predicted metal-dependent hydrolase